MLSNIFHQTNAWILTYFPAQHWGDVSIFVMMVVVSAGMPSSYRRASRITTGILCFTITTYYWLIPGLCLACGGWLMAIELPAAIDRKYPRGKISNAYIWNYVKGATTLICMILCYFTRTGFFLAIIGQIFGIFIPDAIVRKREWQADKLLKTTEEMNNSRLKVGVPGKMFSPVDLVEFPNKPKALVKADRWLGIVVTGIVAVFLGSLTLKLLYEGTKLGYSGAKVLIFQASEQTWPSTQATIISDELRSSTVSKGKVSWSPYWTYSYEVNGTLYYGKSIDVPAGYDAKWFDERADAVNDGLSRPPRSQTTTYYDPAAPRRSVLDKRTARGGEPVIIGLTIGMLALAALFGFFFVSLLKIMRTQWQPVPS